MARINNLTNFLTDISSAIKQKTGDNTPIPASQFDTEILSIETAGNYQTKELTVSSNGNYIISPDQNYDAFEQLTLTIDVQSGIDISDATATENDILFPKTAYLADGIKHTGAIIPTYITGSKSQFFQTNTNTIITGIDNWQTISLGDYTFFYYRYNGDCVFYAVKDDGIEASATFTVSELFGQTTVADVFLTYDSWNQDEYVIVPGKGYNNGNGWTEISCRRIKYDAQTKTFIMLEGIATGGWGETGNNYGYFAYGSQNRPNKLWVQYSYWGDSLHIVYVNIAWTETSGSISDIVDSGRSYPFDYHVRETADGSMFYTNQRLCQFNSVYSSWTTVETAGRMYVSHNKRYAVMGNCLYRIEVGANAAETYNSRVQIGESLPTENCIQFTENDDYILIHTTSGATIIITYNDNTWSILQSVIDTSSGTGWGCPQNGRRFINITSNKVYVNYYTAEEQISKLTRSGINYLMTTEGNSPTRDKVLEGVHYVTNTGENVGTMPNQISQVFSPSVSQQTIPEGYYNGNVIRPVTSDIDINIIPQNIRNGVTILGVEGEYQGATGGDATSDANLQAKYLLEGYSAVVDGQLIQGTMRDYGNYTITPTSSDIPIPEGYYISLSIPVIVASNCADYSECNTALLSI